MKNCSSYLVLMQEPIKKLSVLVSYVFLSIRDTNYLGMIRYDMMFIYNLLLDI